MVEFRLIFEKVFFVLIGNFLVLFSYGLLFIFIFLFGLNEFCNLEKCWVGLKLIGGVWWKVLNGWMLGEGIGFELII